MTPFTTTTSISHLYASPELLLCSFEIKKNLSFLLNLILTIMVKNFMFCHSILKLFPFSKQVLAKLRQEAKQNVLICAEVFIMIHFHAINSCLHNIVLCK